MDIGVTLDHYCSDMTRVVFFDVIDPKWKEIYQVVQQAQQVALDHCQPGESIGKIDQLSRDVIIKAGFGDYYPHGLGHGIGLEVHESPTIKNIQPHASQVLEPGMVITIEPGVYLPGLAGVRIEDTIVITESSYEDLTQRSKELIIL